MATDEPRSSVDWRLRSLEARVSRLESVNPEVIVERVRNISRDLEEVSGEVRALKRALYTFALSISLSAIAFAVAVLQIIR